MPRTYSAEALVLKRTNFGEADRILTFLSKYKGKFTAIAKGVRKVASRRGPNLELLNHVKVYCSAGKNLDVVTEVQTLNTFRNIKDNLKKISLGFHIAEIANEFLAEGQGAREIFELVLRTLKLLDREERLDKANRILRVFEVKLLDAVGFRPNFDSCVKCNLVLDKAPLFLSPEFGGLFDKKCSTSSLFVKPVSTDAVKLLRFFQEESWVKINRLSFPNSLNTETARLLQFYIEYLLEKELKSIKFIEKVDK